MKLPGPLTQILHKEEKQEKMFLSLILEKATVEAAVWSVTAEHTLKVHHIEKEAVDSDSWEEKTECADRAIVRLEQKMPETELHNVVLGLPTEYLTEGGDIASPVRSEVKKLTESLDLKPIGFVPIHQALIHKLKSDEGVPPSVILIHITPETLTLFLYKIGTLVGTQMSDRSDDIAPIVEGLLKRFKDMEVLPSRMLLFGRDTTLLEETKNQLLKYPWPTRANFMHFPKIEVVAESMSIEAVCLAGASEIATVMPEPEEAPPEEESNVTMVEPETLGFKKNTDVLEEPEEAEEEEPEKPKISLPISFASLKLPKISLSSFSLTRVPQSLRRLPIVVGALGIILILITLYWFVPRATVTVFETPEFLSDVASVTVDPTATVADSNTHIIPGKKQEHSVSGEKSIPVTGTKQVGDPAKGTVTIYNKITSSKTFSKGTVLISGALSFTLDGDVTVASASENLAQSNLTYGKANAAITASAIGPNSNLPAGSDFTFKSISSDDAIARNDQVLAGGTSRDITVVTRADYDALIKALTDELVGKAKTDLAQGVGGGEKLIDQTIKSTVTDKTFSQEIDQEAKELHGKVTISVTGISYTDRDLSSLFKSSIESKIPQGYTFSEEQSKAVVDNAQVKKDGTIILNVTFRGAALPALSSATIQKDIAGKSLESAQEYLKNVRGVGGAEFNFRWSPSKNRLPINKNNISVSISLL